MQASGHCGWWFAAIANGRRMSKEVSFFEEIAGTGELGHSFGMFSFGICYLVCRCLGIVEGGLR